MNPLPAPILALHEISLYNTGRVSPEKIIAAFAARIQQFERIVADIAAEKPGSRAQHHLIVGQRGMGKTMLLARIAAELRTKSELAARFIPLVFAEEQYAVDRLSKFWLNCLDSLADAREAANDTKAVEEIDATVARLQAAGSRAPKDDQPFADEVYAAFAAASQATGQRPVLLVDNLQLVFERLDHGQQHSLRELLMRPRSPILVGASPSPPPQTQDYGAAFYDQFKVHYLRPLDESEMRDLLLRLAEAAGRDDVRNRVLQHPGRLKALRQLTGGNPRTTLTLFFLYAEDFSPTVFGDLEGLLDRVTPLYKARFEELTPQQQVIVSAIANHWDPITAAALASATGVPLDSSHATRTHHRHHTTANLPAGTISAQLDRLEKTGVIELTELFGETRTGYMLAERFFNIWFLMRSASRRQRREVEFLTRFLESFYEPTDRSRIARHLMGEDHFSPDRYLWSQAVAASLGEPETAEELKRHAELTVLREEARDARARLHELIDFDSLPKATLDFAVVEKRLKSLVPDDAGITPEDFAKTVLGDRAMFMSGEREQLAARPGKLSREEIQSVLESIKMARATDELEYSNEAVDWFSQWLARGQIRNLRDAEDWNRAFRTDSGEQCLQLMVRSLPDGFGTELTDSSFARIYSVLIPSATARATKWFRWGNDLRFRLARYAEAEAAYRKAIELVPDQTAEITAEEHQIHAEMRVTETASDSNKTVSDDSASNEQLKQVHTKLNTATNQLAKVLSSLRTAISDIPKLAWTEIGFLLHYYQKRFTEAESAYREAIACDPKFAPPWNGLGNLFQYHLQRYAEAESAYREAIARDPNDAFPWDNLGNLLQDHLQRCAEAESAYREAIARDPKLALPWNGLGNLFKDHFQRYAEAESAYREAIARDPNDADPWNNLGNLLQSNLQRCAEAESAYREAIARDPNDADPWNGLGNLYCDHLDRPADAAEAFNNALRIDPSNESSHQNRIFLRRDFMGEGAAARPFMDELSALPKHDFPDTTHLHEALFAAYESNWGLASDALAKAVTLRANGFSTENTDDWLRASAVLLHLNYGAELLTFLDQRGDTVARLRPWVEALRALQIGDRRALQNIAPEIRTTAEVFYDGIERRLKQLPEKTRRRPLPKPKRTRSKGK